MENGKLDDILTPSERPMRPSADMTHHGTARRSVRDIMTPAPVGVYYNQTSRRAPRE